MTKQEAQDILKWHAENATNGKLVDSLRQDVYFETAYRTIYGKTNVLLDLKDKLSRIIQPRSKSRT